jgi:5'-nucleotidase/UDP-sugar diphosphatase
MIESIRKDKQSVLLLDCGSVLDTQRNDANAQLHLKAMERMGYDALNLGVQELLAGESFLRRTRSDVSFPYIASNLLYGGDRPSWFKEYMIKEVGSVKVAILGILDPDDLKQIPNQDDAKGFEAIQPKAALDRLLPEVRGKADVVILLSQLDEAKNRSLLDAVQGIDVSISSGCSGGMLMLYGRPEKDVAILHTGTRGMTMGMVAITPDDQRTLRIGQRKYVLLDGSVPDHAEIAGLVETYKKEQEIKKEKMKAELMKGLQLTPEEFMEQYRNRKTDEKKGEAQ